MARLICGILFFLLALLCIFPAPTYHLWYVSILVTEFPWIFLIIVSVLLFWGFTVKKYRRAGTIVGIIALILFLSPITGAYIASNGINKVLSDFHRGRWLVHGAKKRAPFSFWRMFARVGQKGRYTTLTYVTNTAGPLTMDYYSCQQSGKHPTVIVVHGGSWSAGDSRQLPEINSYLSGAGYNVASINYRLAPNNIYPAQLEDIHAAFQYLRAHAAALSVDTGSFVLLGRSAGGHLVLCAAYTLQEPGLKGVIDFYGPTDMVWGYAHPANPLVLNTCKVMEDFLGGTYAKVPQNYIKSSPTEVVTAPGVPTLIIHGKNDPLVEYNHSLRLMERLNKLGVDNVVISLSWATHGCDYSLNGPSGQLTTYAVENFLYLVTHEHKQN